MILATIFDLDGTLVQTEKLKAISYARAAVELCPRALTEAEVIDAFKDVVGLSRREVALTLMERFDLEALARARMAAFGVSTPWQAYVQVRLGIYNALLDDPATLRENQWPHNIAVLDAANAQGCATALATMSYCPQVERVLGILGWQGKFDFVATRDDVTNSKPDPEIYQMVSRELGIPPAQSLVLEDSPAGVQSALSAGMHVIAVATPFTRERLHASGLLEPRWIVDDPVQVAGTVKAAFEAFGG